MTNARSMNLEKEKKSRTRLLGSTKKQVFDF
jgi:hypothetical protein